MKDLNVITKTQII